MPRVVPTALQLGVSVSNQDHYRKLERMYLAAPINQYFRPKARIDEGMAEITIDVRRDFFHAADAVQGAVYFKALDDATFFAASSLVTGHFLLTVSFNMYFARPVTEGELVAKANVVQHSKRLLVAEGELIDASGRVIARGSGAFMHSEIELTPDVGYQ